MRIFKVAKDWFLKTVSGTAFVPAGLVELQKYFRANGPIVFSFHDEDGLLVATSTNFRHGGIVTHGATREELEKNIRDAILTSFRIPSSYAQEAAIKKVEGGAELRYAAA